ncbi:MAG: InlB B-repeat-containing protein, partial [Clostridia bacterium]|nr:InlB B-repeat-containing protein [Clostridia bacterium]
MKRKLLALLSIAAIIFVFAACGAGKYKVNFYADGEIYSVVSTDGKEAIELPAPPIKDGYTFDGWFFDEGEWKKPFAAESFSTDPISSDISVYAKFKSDHVHDYSARITKLPTCTEEGEKTFTCACGDSYIESVPVAEHSFNDVVTAPTCTERGYTTRTCSVCGFEKITDYTAPAHDFVAIGEPNKNCPLSCYQSYACSRCPEEKRELIRVDGISDHHNSLSVGSVCEYCGWKVHAKHSDGVLMVNADGDISAEFYGTTTYNFGSERRQYVRVYFSDNVKNIDNSFYSCERLESVTI